MDVSGIECVPWSGVSLPEGMWAGPPSQVLDSDRGGSLRFPELQQGMRKVGRGQEEHEKNSQENKGVICVLSGKYALRGKHVWKGLCSMHDLEERAGNLERRKRGGGNKGTKQRFCQRKE